jgi:hypothetical protein
MKAGIVEPEEIPDVRQRFRKYVLATINTNVTVEELLDAVCTCGPCHIKGK